MRFAIATLGCKVNQYDTAVIESRLKARSLEQCDFGEVADVYIVNTCTVTDRADVESLRLARRARRLNPAARVIMTGCLAQASPERLAKSNEVDVVIGLGRPDDLERAVADSADGDRVMVSNLRKYAPPLELSGVTLEGHTRAFLRLQEGCDQFCSYCIVPFSRGASRSGEPRRILAALDELRKRNFVEVVLSGVHLGGYGRDLNPPVGLDDLLEMLAERSPIRRLRLSSLDPEELSDRIIDIVSANECFCPHFHLPLQSGSDSVLKRMRRRYDGAFYRDRIERVLERIPDAAIGTDLIVGFPGESAGLFNHYLKFVGALPLAYFHVFPYSVRSGTTAAKFDERVGPAEIKRRAAIMRALGDEKRTGFIERFARAKLKVLLEQRGAGKRLNGLSRNYLRVVAEGPDELLGNEVDFQASHVENSTLVGAVVPQPAQISPASQSI